MKNYSRRKRKRQNKQLRRLISFLSMQNESINREINDKLSQLDKLVLTDSGWTYTPRSKMLMDEVMILERKILKTNEAIEKLIHKLFYK